MSDQINAIDVWLKFDEADEDEATYEANTYPDSDGEGYTVNWYHTAVGQVSSEWFPEYADAREWLISQGF